MQQEKINTLYSSRKSLTNTSFADSSLDQSSLQPHVTIKTMWLIRHTFNRLTFSLEATRKRLTSPDYGTCSSQCPPIHDLSI